MKVQKVELKEIEIVEVDGEFESRYVNAKTHPAFLTNAAVKRGYDLRIIESSLWEDLLKIKGLEHLIDSGNDDDATKLMGAFDEQKITGVIYLGLLGANKNLPYSYDEFLELYHDGLTEKIEIYTGLIFNLLSTAPNEFAKELNKATKKPKKK